MSVRKQNEKWIVDLYRNGKRIRLATDTEEKAREIEKEIRYGERKAGE